MNQKYICRACKKENEVEISEISYTPLLEFRRPLDRQLPRIYVAYCDFCNAENEITLSGGAQADER